MRRCCWILLAASLTACGGTKVIAVKQIETAAPVQTGPKATPEEVEGQVPPLRALLEAIPLVPERFVPPEPPGDPEPYFE